jgi:hypothetical protein
MAQKRVVDDAPIAVDAGRMQALFEDASSDG